MWSYQAGNGFTFGEQQSRMANYTFELNSKNEDNSKNTIRYIQNILITSEMIPGKISNSRSGLQNYAPYVVECYRSRFPCPANDRILV
jgi:hypothetical protein